MEKNVLLVQTLCLPYCAYYKPGRNEELKCRGAVIVERLLAEHGIIEALRTKAGQEAIELTIEHLCSACDFRQNDCDFTQDRKARPCGGFVLLSGLLEEGKITIKDFRQY